MENISGIHENDIDLGENKWIRWVEYDTSIDDDFDIEYLLKEMQLFWFNMMTVCEALCCGIHAYDFSKENIAKAISDLDKELIISQLDNLKKLAKNSQHELITSTTLNHRLHKKMFLELIEHILNALK